MREVRKKRKKGKEPVRYRHFCQTRRWGKEMAMSTRKKKKKRRGKEMGHSTFVSLSTTCKRREKKKKKDA